MKHFSFHACPARERIIDRRCSRGPHKHFRVSYLHASAIHGQHPEAATSDWGLTQGDANLLILACSQHDNTPK